jgi:DNA-binding IclR family transcriptional regulator
MSSSEVTGAWTFLTNHAHVLICIARDPSVRLRDVAEQVGITERAAQRIVADLVAAGYVSRIRAGRRNRYRVNAALPLRHPLEQDQPVASLLRAVGTLPVERVS